MWGRDRFGGGGGGRRQRDGGGGDREMGWGGLDREMRVGDREVWGEREMWGGRERQAERDGGRETQREEDRYREREREMGEEDRYGERERGRQMRGGGGGGGRWVRKTDPGRETEVRAVHSARHPATSNDKPGTCLSLANTVTGRTRQHLLLLAFILAALSGAEIGE